MTYLDNDHLRSCLYCYPNSSIAAEAERLSSRTLNLPWYGNPQHTLHSLRAFPWILTSLIIKADRDDERPLERRRPNATSSLLSLSFRSHSEGAGPYGLTLLHCPPEPLIDFIFVHGLRGGSFKTWRKQDHPDYFWPRARLPYDPDLQNVRIHTFGYHSDWSE